MSGDELLQAATCACAVLGEPDNLPPGGDEFGVLSRHRLKPRANRRRIVHAVGDTVITVHAVSIGARVGITTGTVVRY